MRGLLWIGVVLAVLWGGYWVVGSTAVERGAAQWFDDQNATGMVAKRDGISVSGFPSRFDLTITSPELADPVTGWRWTAPFVQVLSMTWKPWHVIAALPREQHLQVAGQKIDLTSAKIAASVRVTPSTDLTLQEVVIEGHDILATSDAGWKVATRSLVLAVARDPVRPLDQRVGLQIADLVPAPELAALVPDLGDTISVVHLDATMTLSAALDRHMAETRPQLTRLSVGDFHLNWGSLAIAATGQIDRGPDGLATGQIDFRVRNWRQIPALMVAAGFIRPEMGETLTRGLQELANSGTDPDVLELPLTLADGWMHLGPLPLGPAPLLD